MRLLRNFHLILFSKNQLLHDNIGRRGVFLASNSLHDLWGQKKICPCLNSLNFEQIQWNKIFHRMYGLAVNIIMSVSGHPSIINEIVWTEEYCQTSPNKNKSPNLWHIPSILVCCIFVHQSIKNQPNLILNALGLILPNILLEDALPLSL